MKTQVIDRVVDARLQVSAGFLRGGAASGEITTQDVRDALLLTGYFLAARVLTPAGQTLPDVRARMIELISRNAREP